MSNKPKIAICVSGQTRHLNSDPLYTQDFFNVLDLFSEFDYDLYGHTWADQETPNKHILNNFKNFEKEDQATIWEELTTNPTLRERNQHFSQFIPWRSEWHDKKEYQEILNDNGNFIEFAKQRIYGGIGQVWSAHRCFQQIDVGAGWEKYELIVRLRWDNNILHHNNYDPDSKEPNKHIELFKKILHLWWSNNKDHRYFITDDTADVLSTNQVVLKPDGSIPFINDHIFVFRALPFLQRKLATKNVAIPFSNISKEIKGDCFPAAHNLWFNWLDDFGLSILPVLPDITTGNGPSGNKLNKEWSI